MVVLLCSQKSLTDLYKERIVFHGTLVDSIDAEGFAKKFQYTHLREQIMDEVPGLCVAKSGRTFALTIDAEVGQALF